MARVEKHGLFTVRNEDGEIRYVKLGRVILALILLGAVTWLLVAGFVVVPAGHKGVVVTGPYGPDRNEIGEGWNWNPVYAVSDIEIIRYNTQTRDMIDSEDSALQVRSSDNLDIAMDVSLIYRLPSDKVADVRIERGDFRDLIDRYMRNTPRNVASNFSGEFIGGGGRILVEDEIRRLITTDLGAYDIVIEDFLIRSVDLPESVDIAIEAKKAAEQAVITAEFKRQSVVIQAMANASKLAIEAEGFRNATVIKANGTAEAIRLVIQQLQLSDPSLQNATEAYLTMLYLQALTDPNSNIDFIIITDGGTPIIIQPRP